jgi:ABC-type polysaccharide/polyol phosphate transport system ATPase subunit
MNSSVIKAENIWKSFPLKKDKPGFKEFIVHMPRFLNKNNNVFWALKGINLNIYKGESIAIIGRNGSGKSTLLSLLLGTILPTKGTVDVSLRKTPLLELGAGFHGDLTGVENILINGVILGLTKEEVLERMEDIINFSELGDFIKMPTRTYSSGMYMRLAFSVAIYTNPEILLIDEILSVGDASFQKKSSEALMKLVRSGVTTVYVSHNLESVNNFCNRAVWLEHGEIRDIGEPGSLISEYVRTMTAT